MENQRIKVRKIAFLANLHKDIDAVEEFDKAKADELKQKFYDLAGFKEFSIPISENKINFTLAESDMVKYATDDLKQVNLDSSKQIVALDPGSEETKEERRIHYPRQVSAFLQEFNQLDSLKYYTHKWDKDEAFNIKKYKDAAWGSFELLRKKYPEVPNYLIVKIRAFIFYKSFKPDNGWSVDHIRIGWNTAEITEWCAQNPGKSPYPSRGKKLFLTNPVKLKDGTVIRKFDKIVEKFKSEFEFRADLNNDFANLLKKTINQINPSLINACKLEKITSGISLYTDIEKVMQSIKYILKPINEFLNNGSVEFSFSENIQNNSVELSILHRNSTFRKTLGSFDEKIRKDSGDSLGAAKKLLRSLCDWEMVAKFSDNKFGCYRILPEEGMKESTSEQFEGVKHVLIFYRSE